MAGGSEGGERKTYIFLIDAAVQQFARFPVLDGLVDARELLDQGRGAHPAAADEVAFVRDVADELVGESWSHCIIKSDRTLSFCERIEK